MNELKTVITEQLQQLQILMHRASFHRYLDGAHSPHRGQGRILAMLKIKPEISQRELTYLLNMSKQSLTELISKLEKNGCITREKSTDDKRVMTIKLTEKGAKAADNVSDDAETSQILDCLSDGELTMFNGYLSRLITRYEEQFPYDDYKERHKMMDEFVSRHGHAHGMGRFGCFGDHSGHTGDFRDRHCGHGHHSDRSQDHPRMGWLV
jgi:DNA-binding MarR family transcriptional regulator